MKYVPVENDANINVFFDLTNFPMEKIIKAKVYDNEMKYFVGKENVDRS
jgi:hypothetical protein